MKNLNHLWYYKFIYIDSENAENVCVIFEFLQTFIPVGPDQLLVLKFKIMQWYFQQNTSNS